MTAFVIGDNRARGSGQNNDATGQNATKIKFLLLLLLLFVDNRFDGINSLLAWERLETKLMLI